MIQRKQTFFLFLAALSTAFLAFGTLAEFVAPNASWILMYTGIYSLPQQVLELGTYPLVILVLLSTLISVAAIGLFKKRLLQLRLCGINLAFHIGLAGFIFYFGILGAKQLNAVVVYKWLVVLPFIALVLTVLAMISIAKDEALVRSVNRIRD